MLAIDVRLIADVFAILAVTINAIVKAILALKKSAKLKCCDQSCHFRYQYHAFKMEKKKKKKKGNRQSFSHLQVN